MATKITNRQHILVLMKWMTILFWLYASTVHFLCIKHLSGLGQAIIFIHHVCLLTLLCLISLYMPFIAIHVKELQVDMYGI